MSADLGSRVAQLRDVVQEKAKVIDRYLQHTPSMDAQHIEAAIASLPKGFQVPGSEPLLPIQPLLPQIDCLR